MHDVWDILGIEATDDVGAIERAYAKRLKESRTSEDAEDLQRAYETACGYTGDAVPTHAPVSQQEAKGLGSFGLDDRLDFSGMEPNSEGEDVWAIVEVKSVTSEDAEDEKVEREEDIDWWVDSVIDAENPIQAFREAVILSESLPGKMARLFELDLASRFCDGTLSPYENLPLLAEVVSHYRWDESWQRVIYHWHELEEPVMFAVGARRCRDFVYAVAADKEHDFWGPAQGLLGTQEIGFSERLPILNWIVVLRGEYGEGWYRLLPGDLSDLNQRSEELMLLRERREKSGYSALGWGVGVVTGIVLILIVLTLARQIHYLVKFGWITLRPPSSPSDSRKLLREG